jgi:hypothetical protein
MCAVALLCAVQSSAQKYGVVGGATFSSIHGLENSSKTGWNVGGTVQFKLPLGFSVQPSLVYNCKAAELSSGVGSAGLKVDYIELPVSFQWGPDLILFRPFLDVTPFAGYGLNNKSWSQAFEDIRDSWNDVNRWEYGVGTGLGFDIWKFQVIARYNWNLSSFSDEMTFSGATLSLAYLF